MGSLVSKMKSLQKGASPPFLATIAVAIVAVGAAVPRAIAQALMPAPSNLVASAFDEGVSVGDARMILGTGSADIRGTNRNAFGAFAPASASARTSGPAEAASALATADAFARGGDGRGNIFNHGSAFASLSYGAAIRETLLPPVNLRALGIRLPVDIRVRGRVFVTEEGAGGQVSQARVFVLVGSQTRQIPFFDPNGNLIFSFDEVFQPLIAPDEEFPFILQAHVSVSAFAGEEISGLEPDAAASALAFADPVLSFNQAGFDTIAAANGFPTFTLTDFYRFEFSPFIPEPSSLALLLLAGALLTGRRRVALSSPHVVSA